MIGSKIVDAFDTQEKVRVMIAFAPAGVAQKAGVQRFDTPGDPGPS